MISPPPLPALPRPDGIDPAGHAVGSTASFASIDRALPGLSPPSGARVVYVGRLSSEKGVDVLLRAWALLHDAGSKAEASSADFKAGQAKLTIVGDGPERAALESLSATLGIADRVVFTGALPRDAALAELSMTSLLVFPSLWYETFGMTLDPLVLAAMAVHGGGGHTAGELALMRHFATILAKEF